MPFGNSGVTSKRPLQASRSPLPATYCQSCLNDPIGNKLVEGRPLSAVDLVDQLLFITVNAEVLSFADVYPYLA